MNIRRNIFFFSDFKFIVLKMYCCMPFILISFPRRRINNQHNLTTSTTGCSLKEAPLRSLSFRNVKKKTLMIFPTCLHCGYSSGRIQVQRGEGEEQRAEQDSGGPGTTSHNATLGRERLVDQRRSSGPVERFSLAGRGSAALGGRTQQEELVLSINNQHPLPTTRTTVNSANTRLLC